MHMRVMLFAKAHVALLGLIMWDGRASSYTNWEDVACHHELPYACSKTCHVDDALEWRVSPSDATQAACTKMVSMHSLSFASACALRIFTGRLMMAFRCEVAP
jgi:hypothetical protein